MYPINYITVELPMLILLLLLQHNAPLIIAYLLSHLILMLIKCYADYQCSIHDLLYHSRVHPFTFIVSTSLILYGHAMIYEHMIF